MQRALNMRDSEWKGLRVEEDLQRFYVKKGDLGRNSKRNQIFKKRGGGITKAKLTNCRTLPNKDRQPEQQACREGGMALLWRAMFKLDKQLSFIELRQRQRAREMGKK